MHPVPGSMLQLFSLLTANFAVPNPLIQILPNTYDLTINQTVITAIATAICQQEAHVIRMLRHSAEDALLTEQHLLHALNTECDVAAPVQILDDTEMRSVGLAPSEMCVFVLVLARVSDFQQHIFDPRLGAKQFQRFFVVIEESVAMGVGSSRRGWLRDMFRVFWVKQVLNVVVIFVEHNGGGGYKWFTYTPFSEEAELEDAQTHDESLWHVPLLQEGAANGGGDQLRLIETHSGDANLFANRLGNVHHSRMTVSMSVDEVRATERVHFEDLGFEGVDGRVADLIRERMNATFRYFRPTRPFSGTNTTGVVGDLYFRNANFGFNAQSYLRSLHEGVVEASNSFERHDICILVPNSATEPTMYNLLHTMTPLTWAIVIASVGLMIATYKCMQTAQVSLVAAGARERYAYSWLETISVHFQSFFGDSICTLPSSMPLRVLIWCWCMYSFLITTAFTAKLISSLVLPRHLDDIDTLQELSSSPLNLIYTQSMNSTLWHFLANSDAALLADLRDQMQPVPREAFYALIETERTGNAYLVRNYMAKYIRRKHFDVSNGRSYYHLMHECLLYLPKVYLLEKGSAYVGHVNELLGRFNEMGFMVKWEEETMHRYSLKAGSAGDVEAGADGLNGDGGGDAVIAEEDIKVVITVAHLQTAFYLLAMGLAMAALLFVAELCRARRARRRSLYRVVYFDKQLAREYGCRVD